MSTAQASQPETDFEIVRRRLITLLEYERRSAHDFAAATVRPRDAVVHRAIAAIFGRIGDDVVAGHYDNAIRDQTGTEGAAP